MDTISFKRHRFPPEIIRRAVWLYARFTLSYRDVEDLLAERGLDISYESVRRWLALLHDSTTARVGALFQLLVQDTTAQDFGLPSSDIRLRM